MIISLRHKLWLCSLFLGFTLQMSGDQPEEKSDSLQGLELYRKGVEWGREGEPEKALELFRQSLEFRKLAFGEKHIRLAANYMGMAIQYKNLRQLDNSFRYYQMAEEIYLLHAPANDSRLGDIYSNMGNYFRAKGNLGEAIRYQERAVYIYEHSPDAFPEVNYLSAVYNLADSYYLVNREQEALQLVARFSGKGSFDHRARWLNLKANILATLGNLKEADHLYTGLIAMVAGEYGEESTDVADQYLYYGQFLNLAGRQDTALRWLHKAELIYRQFPNRKGDLADLYNIIGDSHAQRKINSASWEEFRKMRYSNLMEAQKWYERALSILTVKKKGTGVPEREKAFSGEGLVQTDRAQLRDNNYPIATLTTLRNIGLNHLQLAKFTDAVRKEAKTENLQKSAEFLGLGSDLAEYLRTGFVSEESKVQLYTLQQEIFHGVVEASFELYQLSQDPQWAETAFRHAERNKAGALMDQISELESRAQGIIPDSLLRKENDGITSLAWYREKLHLEMQEEEPDPQKLDEYRQKVFEYEELNLRFREQLEKSYPDYYGIKYRQKPLSFDLARKRMKKDEVLLSYNLKLPGAQSDGELYTIALTARGHRFIRQPFTRENQEMVLTVFGILSDQAFLNAGVESFRAYCEAAYSLYNLLILPFGDLVFDKRITVIPDGILNYLPFEALLSEPAVTESVHYHDLAYLIRRHAVSYNYSATLFARDKKGWGNHSVAFAPVYAGSSGLSGSTAALPPIPGALEEVKVMKRKLNTTLYAGEEATEGRFREVAGRFDILHLAMHTLINDSLPLFSRLAFAPGAGGSLEDDGWLNTADVYTLRLKARMAVLGACRSGGGMLRNGEGIISLARGFFYAGCQSVLLSLWEVEDQAGATVMKEFYRNLKAGKSKDHALRNAKLKYLREATPVTAHPRFWMGYVLIGQTDPLFGGISLYLLGLMGLLLVLIAADMVIKKPAGKNPAGDH